MNFWNTLEVFRVKFIFFIPIGMSSGHFSTRAQVLLRGYGPLLPHMSTSFFLFRGCEPSVWGKITIIFLEISPCYPQPKKNWDWTLSRLVSWMSSCYSREILGFFWQWAKRYGNEEVEQYIILFLWIRSGKYQPTCLDGTKKKLKPQQQQLKSKKSNYLANGIQVKFKSAISVWL